MAAVDFDRDGRTDLALLDTESALAIVMRNDGSGNFAPLAEVSVRPGALKVVASDLDRDGAPDLVAGNGGFRSITVAFGKDGGRPEDVQEVVVPVEVRDLALGDLNEDGLVDIVAGGGNAGLIVVSTLRANRSFSDPSILPTRVRSPHVVVLADYNGDGHLDLAVWGRGEEPYLEIYEGDGSGLLGDGIVPGALPDPGDERELSAGAADFDGDGRDELLFLLPAEPDVGDPRGALYLVEKSGAGSYVAAKLDVDSSFSENSRLILASIDADGWPDALTIGEDAGGRGLVSFLRNSATGTIEMGALGAISLITRPRHALIEDFDGDGQRDLAVALPEESRVAVILSPLEESCGSVSCYDSEEPFSFGDPQEVAVLRLAPDTAHVIAAGQGEARLLTLEQDGLREHNRFPAPLVVKGIATGDLDGDGSEDAAVTDFAAGTVEVFFIDQDGQPGPGPVKLNAGLLPVGVVVADLDADEASRLDVATALSGENRIAVFLGRDQGQFSAATYQEAGPRPHGIASGDIDADGLEDLVVTNPDSNRVSLLRGTGEGRFAQPVAIATVDDPRTVVVEDVDGNGRQDVIVSSLRAGAVGVLLAGKEGFRTCYLNLPQAALPQAVAVAEVAGGGMDILVADAGSRSLLIFALQGKEYATREVLFLPAATAASLDFALALGDLDADGLHDIAVGDAGRNEIRIYRGLGCLREALFRRGDTNQDGRLDLTDAVRTLLYLFASGEKPACSDAADADDDGALTLADAVSSLNYLFRGGRPPPPPGPTDCGEDPTEDALEDCRGAPCR